MRYIYRHIVRVFSRHHAFMQEEPSTSPSSPISPKAESIAFFRGHGYERQCSEKVGGPSRRNVGLPDGSRVVDPVGVSNIHLRDRVKEWNTGPSTDGGCVFGCLDLASKRFWRIQLIWGPGSRDLVRPLIWQGRWEGPLMEVDSDVFKWIRSSFRGDGFGKLAIPWTQQSQPGLQ